MKLFAWFFSLSAINWIVVCWMSWAWVLGFNPNPWKMLVMAIVAGLIQTAVTVIHMTITRASQSANGKEG